MENEKQGDPRCRSRVCHLVRGNRQLTTLEMETLCDINDSSFSKICKAFLALKYKEEASDLIGITVINLAMM